MVNSNYLTSSKSVTEIIKQMLPIDRWEITSNLLGAGMRLNIIVSNTTWKLMTKSIPFDDKGISQLKLHLCQNQFIRDDFLNWYMTKMETPNRSSKPIWDGVQLYTW